MVLEAVEKPKHQDKANTCCRWRSPAEPEFRIFDMIQHGCEQNGHFPFKIKLIYIPIYKQVLIPFFQIYKLKIKIEAFLMPMCFVN